MKGTKETKARILAAKIAKNASEYIGYSVDIKNKMSVNFIEQLTSDIENGSKSPAFVKMIVKSAIA